MPTLHLTAVPINKLPLAPTGQVLYRDSKLQGFGLRVGTKSKAYFVEKRVDGRTVRTTLGIHGQITPDQARDMAVIALGKMTGGADLNVIKKAKTAERHASTARAANSAKFTLKALCDHYVTSLETQGKQSTQDVRGIFKKHVEPSALASMPAKSVTPREITALLRTLTTAKKNRTAAKLRSYLRAAYGLAQGAENNAHAAAEMIAFDIETNPVASTVLKVATNARETTLQDVELGEVMRLLEAARASAWDDGLAAFELGILLGGQRPAQVLAIDAEDVDIARKTISLYDSKGRRAEARRHQLPLQPLAFALVEQILKHRRAAWLFGDKSARTVPLTLSRKARLILDQAQENLAPDTPKRELQARDLRRTAETMLAGMAISKETRAQLLSHGLGGVQDRHYDRHDYMPEKTRALQAWEDRLEGLKKGKAPASNVVPIAA